MSDFTSYAQAEARAREKVADGTWLEAHVARATVGGKIVIRAMRPMSPSAPDEGAWVELDDDAEE